MTAELERVVTLQASQLLEANGRIAELHFELERLRAIEQRARAVANGMDTDAPTSWARKQVARHILGEAS